MCSQPKGKVSMAYRTEAHQTEPNFSKNGFRKAVRFAAVVPGHLLATHAGSGTVLCIRPCCDRFQLLKHDAPAHSSDGVQMVKEHVGWLPSKQAPWRPMCGDRQFFRASQHTSGSRGSALTQDKTRLLLAIGDMPLRRPLKQRLRVWCWRTPT